MEVINVNDLLTEKDKELITNIVCDCLNDNGYEDINSIAWKLETHVSHEGE